MKDLTKVLLMTRFGSLINSSSAKADWDYYAIENIEGSEGFKVYICEAGNCILRGTQNINWQGWKASGSYVNTENELIIQGEPKIMLVLYITNIIQTLILLQQLMIGEIITHSI